MSWAERGRARRKTAFAWTEAGFATRQVIHDTVIERHGSREFVAIEPCLRHGRRTWRRISRRCRPGFRPSIPSSYSSDATPVGASGEAEDAPRAVTVAAALVEVAGAILPQSDGVELKPEVVGRLVAEAARDSGLAPRARHAGDGEARLIQAAYHPEDRLGSQQTTVISKSTNDTAEAEEEPFEDLYAGAQVKTLKVGSGDTLMSLFTKIEAEPAQAKEVIDALEPIFTAKDLKPGQEVRFTLFGAFGHGADGTGQGLDLRQGHASCDRGAQPPGRVRGVDRADRGRCGEATAGLSAGNALHELLPS